MKISKLFHWLYAILMLLPIFSIGVTCAYAIFNKNAYQSYSGKNTNEYELVNIEEQQQLVVGENYLFQNNQYISNSISGAINISYFKEENSGRTYEDISMYLTFYTSSNTAYVQLYRIDNNQNQFLIGYTLSSQYVKILFTFDSIRISLNSELLSNLYFVQYENNYYIDNVFYYSIHKVEQSPLFNWAYDSFLATPITYITNLFGIATDHIAVMLLSYWLTISILWLVFDLIMYIPLLVHRWLDKGVLE